MTERFPLLPDTQRERVAGAVVDHLGLREWQIMELTTEIEALGSIGTGALRRHGLYWGPNAHSMVPTLEAASGGALVTGNGGDEVLIGLGMAPGSHAPQGPRAGRPGTT